MPLLRQFGAVPNLLTLVRLFIIPFIVISVLDGRWHIGFALTMLAGFSDAFDGLLARWLKQHTTLGLYLDPIADKLLISAALVALVQVRAVPGYLAILIIGREFAVSGLRSIAAAEGYTIQASDLGKTKMISQVVAICVVLLGLRHPSLRALGSFCMWVVVFFAVTSAIGYFVKFWRHIDESIKLRRRSELLQEERRRLEARQRGSETGSGVGVRT